MNIRRVNFLFLLGCVLFFAACGDDNEEPAKSSEKQIIEFIVNGYGINNVSGSIDEAAHTIEISLPYRSSDITSVKPTIKISNGAVVQPYSGDPIDLSSPVTYVVTAEDGSVQNYKVSVKFTSFEPKIRGLNRYKFIGGNRLGITGDFSETGNKVILKKTDADPIILEINSEGSSYISALIPATIDLGEYELTVVAFEGELYEGSVTYQDSKIIIIDPEELRPEILSISPTSIIRGTESRIYFKTKNVTDLDGEWAKLHYVKGEKDGTTGIWVPVENDSNDFFTEVWKSWSVGTYTFYLERDGYKSNEVTFEIQRNPYPVPVVTSVSTYTPVEGEIITMTGQNFSKVSDYDTYITVNKVTNAMGYHYPFSTIYPTIVDDGTITFSLPYKEASEDEEIDGLVSIEITANGQSLFYLDKFTVQKK